MTFEYCYLFPVSILVATTAMASGVGERLPQKIMERTPGILFILVALATLGEAMF